LIPGSRWVAVINSIDILGKYNSKASFKMPVNVTVHNPWSGIVCLKTDCDLIAWCSCTDDITDNGIDVVVAAVCGTSNDMESVPV